MPVAPGIITNGLGGNAANMIVGHFHLGFGVEIIIPPVEPGKPAAGGGGTYPVWPDRTEDWDKDAPQSIIIRITHNDEVTEKMYVVSSKKAKFVISVANFISKTRELISVRVSNVKNRMADIVVKFKNNKK